MGAISTDPVLGLIHIPAAPPRQTDWLGVGQVASALGATALTATGAAAGLLSPAGALGIGALVLAEIGALGQLRSRRTREAWQAWAQQFDEQVPALTEALAGLDDTQALRAGLELGERILAVCHRIPALPREAGRAGRSHGDRLLHWIAGRVDGAPARFGQGLRAAALLYHASVVATDG